MVTSLLTVKSQMLVSQIRVGPRVRKDVGDVSALAASIAELGMLHPVVMAPDGTLVAGARRLAAAKLLGWEAVPVTVVHDIVEAMSALRAEVHENTQRADIPPDELAEVINALEPIEREAAKVRQRTLNNRETASDESQEARGEALEAVAGAVGMGRQKLTRLMDVMRAAEEEPEKYSDLREKVHNSGKVDGAYKTLVERRQAEELTRRARAGFEMPDVPGAQLIHGDFRHVMADMPPASVDVIVTDPPYEAAFLPQYEGLSYYAAYVLKPGGSLVVMSGQSYLPEVMRLLGTHMSYYWTGAYLTPGNEVAKLWQRRVSTFWKPLLWYVNGEPSCYVGKWVGDVCKSEANDKEHHRWGQSLSGMADIVWRFCEPGELVLDPLMGAGTTGLVTLRAGGRFIGIDSDEEQVNIARARFNELFDGSGGPK